MNLSIIPKNRVSEMRKKFQARAAGKENTIGPPVLIDSTYEGLTSERRTAYSAIAIGAKAPPWPTSSSRSRSPDRGPSPLGAASSDRSIASPFADAPDWASYRDTDATGAPVSLGKSWATRAAKASLGITSAVRFTQRENSFRPKRSKTRVSPDRLMSPRPMSPASQPDLDSDEDDDGEQRLNPRIVVRDRGRSPSPSFSEFEGPDARDARFSRLTAPSPDFSEEDSSLELRPPVPKKNSHKRSGSKPSTTSQIPQGMKALGAAWDRPVIGRRAVNSIDAKAPNPAASSAEPPPLKVEVPAKSADPTEETNEVSAKTPKDFQSLSRFSWLTRSSSDANKLSRFSWLTRTSEPESPRPPIVRRRSGDAISSPMPNALDIPRSRFSWTTTDTKTPTHATSPSFADSVEDEPPLPVTAPSVLSRGRPIPGPNAGLNIGIKTAPKSSPSQIVKRKPAPSHSSAAASKDLPLGPELLDSVDHVTGLQAQLDELARRKANLNKVLDTLNKLSAQSPVVHDLAKRRQDREEIQRFEAELAEVRRREHDVGLRLHRALKKRDQEEPSGLWVRRVTS